MPPTNPEIRLEIAKKLGWTNIYIFPSGKWVGTSPEGNFYRTIPDWPFDYNEAFILATSDKYPLGFCQLQRLEDGRWRVWYRRESGVFCDCIDADTAPRAMSLAWLATRGIVFQDKEKTWLEPKVSVEQLH